MTDSDWLDGHARWKKALELSDAEKLDMALRFQRFRDGLLAHIIAKVDAEILSDVRAESRVPPDFGVGNSRPSYTDAGEARPATSDCPACKGRGVVQVFVEGEQPCPWCAAT